MCYKNFRLENGILMYVRTHLSDLSPVVAIPRSNSSTTLSKYHDNIKAGHPRHEETYNFICCYFFWTCMHHGIASYIQACPICACTKATNQKPSTAMHERRPQRPWEVTEVDTMGPYPRTAQFKTCILVVTDLFTQWVEAFDISEVTSSQILNLLQTDILSRYGYPCCLLSDNGREFTSQQWKQTLSDWGIEHWITLVYDSRANPNEHRNKE